MKIDLKYLLPFVMPFVVLGVFESLFYLAGANIRGGEAALGVFSFIIGIVAGCAILGLLKQARKEWTVTMGIPK